MSEETTELCSPAFWVPRQIPFEFYVEAFDFYFCAFFYLLMNDGASNYYAMLKYKSLFLSSL